MTDKAARPSDRREACLREAIAIVETSGVEGLSLREVSRRLGISHQAPYKHFASRDHLLAEIVARTFDAFSAHLEARPRHTDPFDDMETMGIACFTYAEANPLQYRLMFETPLPDPAEHPAMKAAAQRAFGLLVAAIERLPLQGPRARRDAPIDLDALFVWSAIHGLISMLNAPAMQTLDFPAETLRAAIPHTLACIGRAIETRTDD
ncbi:TetR/AcrR family transcriptional regulator [Bauldia sp.]|uniref:TetR/AcrR family transcriptional regulator n=1 Tax=Bauldia sp. TaxID=2575872 RepID=UPI003BA9A068